MIRMFPITVQPSVTLRLFTAADAEPMFRLIDRNREHLRRWLPWVDATTSPADFASWVETGLEQMRANLGWHAMLEFRGQPVGSIGFKPVDWPNMRVEIGYWLAQEYEGHGLMTDTARCVTSYAFREWGLNRVEIRCAAANERSAGVARRLGFSEEGLLREAFKVGDEYQDLRLFGMLRREWAG